MPTVFEHHEFSHNFFTPFIFSFWHLLALSCPLNNSQASVFPAGQLMALHTVKIKHKSLERILAGNLGHHQVTQNDMFPDDVLMQYDQLTLFFSTTMSKGLQ